MEIIKLMMGCFLINSWIIWKFKYITKDFMKNNDYNFARFSKWYIIPSSWIRKKFHLPKKLMPFHLVINCYLIVFLSIINIPHVLSVPLVLKYVQRGDSAKAYIFLILWFVILEGIFNIIVGALMKRK